MDEQAIKKANTGSHVFLKGYYLYLRCYRGCRYFHQ